jgi:hypothetical protein
MPAKEATMRVRAGDSDEIQASVPLRVARSARIDLTRAHEALMNLDWLGPPVASPVGHEDLRRVSVVLELPILDGSAPGPIRKTALVDIGTPAGLGGPVVVEVGWQSDSLSPLFPVFAGQLRITTSVLVLDGHYAPPFGRLGLLIDRHILHVVARRTAAAFLSRLAAHIED